MAIPIGTLGTIPTLTVGGRVFTDLTNLIILYGMSTTSTHNWSTLRKQNGSSGYTVTSGKTLTINAVTCITPNSTAPAVSLLYGTSDVGLDSGSAPTGAVYLAGGSSTNTIYISQCASSGSSLSQISSGSVDFQVPAGKYPCGYMNTQGCSMSTLGYEA